MTPLYEVEMPWWRQHRDATDRVRPANVEEQARYFKRTGEIVEYTRVVRVSDWYTTEGQQVVLVRTEPA